MYPSSIILATFLAVVSACPQKSSSNNPDPSKVFSPTEFLFISQTVCGRTGSDGSSASTDSFCNSIVSLNKDNINDGRVIAVADSISSRSGLLQLGEEKCRDMDREAGQVLTFRRDNCLAIQSDPRQGFVKQYCIAIKTGTDNFCDGISNKQDAPSANNNNNNNNAPAQAPAAPSAQPAAPPATNGNVLPPSNPSAPTSPAGGNFVDPSQMHSPKEFIFVAQKVCQKSQFGGSGVINQLCESLVGSAIDNVTDQRVLDIANQLVTHKQLEQLAISKCNDLDRNVGQVLLFRRNNCLFSQTDPRQVPLKTLCVILRPDTSNFCDGIN